MSKNINKNKSSSPRPTKSNSPRPDSKEVILLNSSERNSEVATEALINKPHFRQGYLKNTLLKKRRFVMLGLVSCVYASINFRMDLLPDLQT